MGEIFLSILVLVILSMLSGTLPRRYSSRGVKALYLVVVPLAIAALFTIVQYSPSPAGSVKQGIVYLLALSAMCLSLTLPMSLLVALKRDRRSFSGLWFFLGVMANIYLLCGLHGSHGGFPLSSLGLRILESMAGFSFTHFELVVGIVLALFTFLGVALRLGPTIPCMFLGIIALRIFLNVFFDPGCAAYEVDIAYPAAIQEDIMVLLFGALFGAALGFVLECRRERGRVPLIPTAQP